jgi:hypothetical protein
MKQQHFADIICFLVEYLWIGRLLDFVKSVVCGSYTFSIYKSKMLALEDLIMQALEVTLWDDKVLILCNAIRIAENVATPNEQNRLTANSFA